MRFAFMTLFPRSAARLSESMHVKALSKGLKMVVKSFYDTNHQSLLPFLLRYFLTTVYSEIVFVIRSFAKASKMSVKTRPLHL